MEQFKSIKNWNADEQPREKLQNKGKTSLSIVELLAILISTGSKYKNELGKIVIKSALDLAKDVSNLGNGQIEQICSLSLEELQQVKGIGPAKAISIAAALELGVRRQAVNAQNTDIKITNSNLAFEYLKSHLQDLQTEQFWVLFLRRNLSVIKAEQISIGGIASTIVDAAVIFKRALLLSASSIIICHNHPSGELKPSAADIKITKELVQAGILLNISVGDHLIIGKNGFYSLLSNNDF